MIPLIYVLFVTFSTAYNCRKLYVLTHRCSV